MVDKQSGINESDQSPTVNLQPKEAHLASLCVAIVFGVIGGGLALLLKSNLPLSITATYIIASISGFSLPWIICRSYFVTAHRWYGAKSISHRIYDLIGIFAATLFIYLVI